MRKAQAEKTSLNDVQEGAMSGLSSVRHSRKLLWLQLIRQPVFCWDIHLHKLDDQNKGNVLDPVATLKQCCKTRDLEFGQRIHQTLQGHVSSQDIIVANSLVNMYSKCGNIYLARDVFEQMTCKDVVTWNTLIAGFVEHGENSIALNLLSMMDCAPSHVTFLSALKACMGLALDQPEKKPVLLIKCIGIHEEIKKRGFDTMIVVTNTLLDMYMKLGDCKLAQILFENAPYKDVITWTCLILGYVDNGECLLALEKFKHLDCRPDRVTFVAALKACAGLARGKTSENDLILEQISSIHMQTRRDALDSDVSIATCLVDAYRRCENMNLAKVTFDNMPHKTLVAWTCLILGYVESGEYYLALKIFESMECEPDEVTFVAAIKACTGLASLKLQDALENAVYIHEKAKACSLNSKIFVSNSLISMYHKLGEIQRAKEVFDVMKCKDVVTWNTVIQGYVENGENLSAVDHFYMMDCEPDAVTYTAVIKSCTGLAAEKILEIPVVMEIGVAVHEQLKVRGFETDITLASALIFMYSRCRSMQYARDVFDRIKDRKHVVTWNCLLQGYIENDDVQQALELFDCIDCEPSHVTFIVALKACICLVGEKPSERESVLHRGVAIEKLAQEFGIDFHVTLSSALIDMYSKCGDMVNARRVFEKMAYKDTIAWTCLMQGYVDNGEGSTALTMFDRMGCEPNHATYITALRACRDTATVSLGRGIHGTICKLGLESDVNVANALLDFYGRCGYIGAAEKIFNNMHAPGIVSWNTLMTSYSSYGDWYEVFNLAHKIQEAGLRMDAVTLICMLTTCRHAGMVEEGKVIFDALQRYGVSPSVEHYTCMIDMLIRANKSEEALSIVYNMPHTPDEITWKTLLISCNKRQVARTAFQKILSGNKTHAAAAYVLLSRVYGSPEDESESNH